MQNFNKFFLEYCEDLNRSLSKISLKKLEEIFKVIELAIKRNKNIFTCGNGGSASVSNHFLCDFNKGIKIDSKKKFKPKVISLTNSIEMMSAISNDLNYEKVFSFQLENYSNKNDILICFSCSGSSKNILEVVKFAKRKKLKTIGFLGFANLKNEKLFDYSININFKNYGVTEDIFQILMHSISQFIRKKNIKNFKKSTYIL
tara:strand:- start:156 stop:761 length:606 start_codon:yes stop_codon:yes gene_type:complete